MKLHIVKVKLVKECRDLTWDADLCIVGVDGYDFEDIRLYLDKTYIATDEVGYYTIQEMTYKDFDIEDRRDIPQLVKEMYGRVVNITIEG